MTKRQTVRALKSIQRNLKKLLVSMRQTDATDVDVKEMIGFLEGINEPLESKPLGECLEDLRVVDEFLHVHESDVEELEAIEEEVKELIEDVDESPEEDDEEEEPTA